MSGNVSTFVAGGISKHLKNWKELTNDEFILDMVKGSKIPIDDLGESNQTSFRKNDISKENMPKIESEIQKLLKTKVIEETETEEGEHISPIFVVPKPDGSVRLILNLKKFNESVEYQHFKMENAATAMQMMRKNCYMASVDLRSAYYSVPVDKNHRKYLKFIWNGQLYQFTCFPNGLTNCPRYFTKLMKPVYAFLRSRGHLSTAYIDDSYLQAQSVEDCLKNIEDTITILEKLGFLIHLEKSVLTPCQEIKYLGFVLNSVDMTVRLTVDKAEKLKNACMRLKETNRKKGMCSIREIAQVIGLLVASFQAVLWGPLHYRQLENAKSVALKKNKGDFESKTHLPTKALKELDWWIENIETAFYPLETTEPHLVIKTDASTSGGWGAVCGPKEAGGRWKKEEKELNINCLELLAILYALICFKSVVKGRHVKILTDNTCAVTYIRKMGGSKSMKCNEIANSIWNWCIEESVWLTVSHIPGKKNVEADKKSRIFDDHTEWKLNPKIFQKVQEKLGVPKIDLFASRLNYQIKPFVSWGPDPEASAVDAFTLKWETFAYAFPPFCLIQRILAKVERDQADVMMIVPLWATAAWFPHLLRLLTSAPILLPRGRNLLQLAHSREPHPLHKRLQLLAVLISGKPLKQEAYRRKLVNCYAPHGEKGPKNNMMFILRSGNTFVLKDKLIRCIQL